MSLSQLAGNDRIKDWLRRAASSNRLPSALIFAGPEGVGKKTFALALGKALNCPNSSSLDSCDRCPVCRRIDAGQYPDLSVIAPDGQFIKVDQVREVVDAVHYRPFEGRRRVYIFENAERLREQAANALLKTLEEPPPHALLILVTASPDALLPTIRSRAVRLRFAPLAERALTNYLKEHHPRPAAEMNLLIRLAQGSIGRALSIDLSQFTELRTESLELVELLVTRRNLTRLMKLAEQVGRKERAEFDERLALLMMLLRDLLCLRLNAENEVINFDIVAQLKNLAANADSGLLTELIGRLGAIERELVRNINRQLALESLFLTLCRESPMSICG